MYYLILKVNNLCPSIHQRLDRSGMSVLRGEVKCGPTILDHTYVYIYIKGVASDKLQKDYEESSISTLHQRYRNGKTNGKTNNKSHGAHKLEDRLCISSVL